MIASHAVTNMLGLQTEELVSVIIVQLSTQLAENGTSRSLTAIEPFLLK